MPKVKPLNVEKSARARAAKLKAAINNKQRAAWIKNINKGYSNQTFYPKDDSKQSIRICMHHFHPNTLGVSEKGKIVLKIGACPTMNLTKLSMTSETFNETKSLPRFFQNLEEKE